MLLTDFQAAGIQLVSYMAGSILYTIEFSTVVRHDKEMLKCLGLYNDELTIGECSRPRRR